MSMTAPDPVGPGRRREGNGFSSRHVAQSPHLRDERLSGWVIGGVRIAMGILWLTNAGWKTPPDFGRAAGRGLYRFTAYAVEHEVFPPFAYIVREVVLPNFTLFGWGVLILEASLGAFLLLGLGTRGWALVGTAHAAVITLSTLNAPGEWNWGYYMFIAIHLLLVATAAGRYVGFDGLMRPAWVASGGRFARLMMRLS
jgi:thiosulfate dehydrogenase (quinone) large subunit